MPSASWAHLLLRPFPVTVTVFVTHETPAVPGPPQPPSPLRSCSPPGRSGHHQLWPGPRQPIFHVAQREASKGKCHQGPSLLKASRWPCSGWLPAPPVAFRPRGLPVSHLARLASLPFSHRTRNPPNILPPLGTRYPHPRPGPASLPRPSSRLPWLTAAPPDPACRLSASWKPLLLSPWTQGLSIVSLPGTPRRPWAGIHRSHLVCLAHSTRLT